MKRRAKVRAKATAKVRAKATAKRRRPSASARASFVVPSVLVSSRGKSPTIEKNGAVYRGKRFDPELTARYYAPVFKAVKGKSRNKQIKAFAAYFAGQYAAGRVPVKPKKGLKEFGAYFGSNAPKGSKVIMLPRKFSKGLDLRGNVPVLRTKTLETALYFFDFLTPEWLEELDSNAENPETQEDMIKEAVTQFVRGLPVGLYSVSLLTGDYAKGSTFDRPNLIKFLTDLFMRFVRSKSAAELSDFAVGVNVITKRKKKRARK